jgi:hypothetical protein
MILAVIPKITMPNSFGCAALVSLCMMTGFVLKKVGLMTNAGKIIAACDAVSTARASTDSTIRVDMIAMVRPLMIFTVRREIADLQPRFGTLDIGKEKFVFTERAPFSAHVMFGTQRTRVVLFIGILRATVV